MTTAVHIRDGPRYIVCVGIVDFLSKFIHRKLLSSSGSGSLNTVDMLSRTQ